MHWKALLAFVCGLAVTTPAYGVACNTPLNFVDVPTADPFCSTIDWLRNRGITVGCGNGTAFCPDDVVTRKTMAAFMNRLANALDPVVVRVEATGGGLSLATPQTICTTPLRSRRSMKINSPKSRRFWTQP